MNSSVRLIPSGFSFIDKNWGGIYRGGSYLTIGQRKSGKTLVALQFAVEAAKASEVCLYFTNMRPKDLMIQAAALNFDIQSYMNRNLIIVVRVAPPNDIHDMYNPDEYLVDYMNDIITVVKQYNPKRIIFDELTPYIGFRNLELLHDNFLYTLETIEERDITSLFIIGEPATQKASEIVDVLAQNVTGIIHLKKQSESLSKNIPCGKVTITPNVGHAEGQFSSEYNIEPNIGVTPVTTTEKVASPNESMGKTFHEKSIQPIQSTQPLSEPYAFSNVYNYSDFLLILNNQIALFNSTGQTFNLISFRLDPTSQIRGLLSLNQLQNAIRLSTTKKDKICVIDNKIVILFVRSNQRSSINLMNNVQNNLPSLEDDYLQAVSEYITVFNIEVSEKFGNADKMMEYVLSADSMSNQNYTPITKFIG